MRASPTAQTRESELRPLIWKWRMMAAATANMMERVVLNGCARDLEELLAHRSPEGEERT